MMVLPEGLATFDVAAVDGSLKSGKFSVYVVEREEKYITAPYDAGSSVVRSSTLARYDFDGNTKASPGAYATARLSVTTVYPHGNGTFALFDLNSYGILADVFDYHRPTLCRFAGSGATTIEKVADDFSGDLSDYSTGLAHGTVDGTDIFSTPNVFATYAVRPVGSQTEVGDVTVPITESSPVRYYTVTGIAVDAPSRPGIYLAAEGSRVKKIVVK